jgi:hypothetical protein
VEGEMIAMSLPLLNVGFMKSAGSRIFDAGSGFRNPSPWGMA